MRRTTLATTPRRQPKAGPLPEGYVHTYIHNYEVDHKLENAGMGPQTKKLQGASKSQATVLTVAQLHYQKKTWLNG